MGNTHVTTDVCALETAEQMIEHMYLIKVLAWVKQKRLHLFDPVKRQVL